MKCQSNPEIKEIYKKRYQKIPNFFKKLKNQVSKLLRKKAVIRLRFFFNTKNKAPIEFRHYATKACIRKIS